MTSKCSLGGQMYMLKEFDICIYFCVSRYNFANRFKRYWYFVFSSIQGYKLTVAKSPLAPKFWARPLSFWKKCLLT